jgi:hypothetical protein
VNHFFNPKNRRWLAVLLAAAGMALTQPAAAETSPPPPAATASAQTHTVVAYDTSIKQEHFAGLSKDVVRRMQQQLQAIYQELPDWQRDYARKEQPLNDGIVGPITLRWLQRYAFNFKIETEGEYAEGLAKNVDRIAGFGAKHPAELAILLSNEFDTWFKDLGAEQKVQDTVTLRQGNDVALLDLVNRFRASRRGAPNTPATALDMDHYFTYVLEQADLDLLAGKDQVMVMLGKIKDKHFNSKEEMKIALLQVMHDRKGLLDQVWPAVESNTHEFYGYAIGKAALERLKKAGTVRADMLADLEELGNVYLTSRDEYDKFIKAKVAAGVLAINAQETEILAAETEVFDNYHIDGLSLDTIKSQLKGLVQNDGVPEVVKDLLEQIKEVDYVELGLFRNAAISKIAIGLATCPLNSPRNNAYVAGLRIGDDKVTALKKALESLAKEPGVDPALLGAGLDEAFSGIQELRNKKVLCEAQDKLRGENYSKGIYLTYLAPLIESVAQKKITNVGQINITGSKCGCALDDLSGVVYGFYPYWKPQDKPQAINFRLLNRIVYYGLTIDGNGDFKRGTQPFDIENGGRLENDFVRVAHQHNSRVDWMIQKNEWSDWLSSPTSSKVAFFKRIEANVLTLLTTQRNDTASRLRPYTSFGLAGPPRRGDGITLYFPEYPDDPESKALFNTFYLALRTEMDKHGLWLNVLVSQDTLTEDKQNGGAFSLVNMAGLRKKRSATEPTKAHGASENDEYVLVLMNEPSSDAKKKLRSDIENDSGLYGADRADFLRSVLPIWHFDDRNFQQLEDDIVYSRDNFGGVGFWAPDFENMAKEVKDTGETCLQSKSMTICLLKNYRDETVSASLPGPVEAFVCVHRWWFQLLLTALLLVMIAMGILYFRVCRVQNLINRYFLLVLGLVGLPALVTFTLLMGYDPYFAKLSHGQLPFIAASTLLVVVLAGGAWYLRSRREVPLRERGLPQRAGMGFPIVRWELKRGIDGFQWIITNGGTGYAIINKVEILIDQHRVADLKTALSEIWESESGLPAQSVSLIGQKLKRDESLVALTIPNSPAVEEFEQKLKRHKLQVLISYTGASNEHWVSNGKEIMLASET